MKVSAILPTRGRRKWAHAALECFFNQTYPEKEIIILDDAEDASFGLEQFAGPSIKYIATTGYPSIPWKRNACCIEADGEIVMHLDSDDWSAPGRMADQVHRLEQSGKAVTGYHSMLFQNAATGDVAKYCGDGSYAIGTSLCYRKSWWREHPFNENKLVEEDNEFVWTAAAARELISVDAGMLMVARVHEGNTSPKKFHRFYPVPAEYLPEAFRMK